VLCVYFVFECIVHACVVLPGLTCVCVYGVRVLVVLCVLFPMTRGVILFTLSYCFRLYDKYSLTFPFIVLLLLNNTRVRPS